MPGSTKSSSNSLLSGLKILGLNGNIFLSKKVKKTVPDFTQIRWSEEFGPNKMKKIV